MNLYWLYNIPSWALFLLVVGLISTISIGGCLLLRDKFDVWLGLDEHSNDIVGHFLAFVGVFYGLILGLVAVGAWDTYNSADGYVQDESARLAALYRDVSQLRDPYRAPLQMAVRLYTWEVINKEWPEQQTGILPSAGEGAMSKIAEKLFAVPTTDSQSQIVVTEAASQFNKLVEARRTRVQSATAAIPGSLWFVLGIGTLIVLMMTWLLRINNKRLDIIINLLTGTMMGTVLAFIVAMDNPYRGEISVSSESFQLIYERLMEGHLDKFHHE
jgi:Protein of unknown function (DUF4239)